MMGRPRLYDDSERVVRARTSRDKWATANPDKVAKKRARMRRKHGPRLALKQAEYVAKNKERVAELRAAWREANKDKIYEQHLKRKFGITLEDVRRMERTQRFRCAICRKKEKLHVDHCHRTGMVRGLLCGNCNRAIGLLKDSPKNLRAAISYLERAR